jgi:MoaA/NifB/PqqE/SkfB family radical SAM enzyme
MLDLARRYPGYHLFRRLGFPVIPPLSLAVSVTHRCNSRCATCRVTRKKPDELTPKEYAKIFKSIRGGPRWITITGGEPFMRADLAEIGDSMVRLAAPDAVTIATNAYFTDRILSFVRAVVRPNPKVRFVINLSIDAIGPAHDKIRGVRGGFDRAMETFHALKDLELENVSLGFHTVISKFNLPAVPDLMEYLKVFGPEHHHFEIAQNRAELNVRNEDIAPPAGEYEKLVMSLLDRTDKKEGEFFTEALRLFRREYYKLTLETIKEKEQVLPCFAGVASAQIGPNGDVWPCCVLARAMGNFRDKDYDFGKVWSSRRADSIRRFIREKNCFCPMANAAYTNMMLHPGTLMRIASRYLMRVRFDMFPA